MIILASASPRRRDILEMLGFEYRIAGGGCYETVPPEYGAEQTVKELSLRKAMTAVGEAGPEDIVLGMDTMVCLDGRLLGKPESEREAADMLRSLSGRRHTVYTGYTVICGKERFTGCETADVYFRDLSDSDIDFYVATGEPMDKAGAYGIQGKGALLVERICGDYYTVVGFPVCSVFKTAAKMTKK